MLSLGSWRKLLFMYVLSIIVSKNIHKLFNHIIIFCRDLYTLISKTPKNRCAFIAPGAIDEKTIEREGPFALDTIFKTMMHNTDKDFFLAPYGQGWVRCIYIVYTLSFTDIIILTFFRNHFSLLIIRPRHRLVYILDSMMSEGKEVETYKIKEIMEM